MLQPAFAKPVEANLTAKIADFWRSETATVETPTVEGTPNLELLPCN